MSENNENLELNEAVENNAAEVEATPVVETQKIASAVAEEEFDYTILGKRLADFCKTLNH